MTKALKHRIYKIMKNKHMYFKKVSDKQDANKTLTNNNNYKNFLNFVKISLELSAMLENMVPYSAFVGNVCVTFRHWIYCYVDIAYTEDGICCLLELHHICMDEDTDELDTVEVHKETTYKCQDPIKEIALNTSAYNEFNAKVAIYQLKS
uniref:Uncharacterized protein n=1 Tax=Romanomermis culicivorax TaxID=13658 RepID=A0A915HPT3_ROMCU